MLSDVLHYFRPNKSGPELWRAHHHGQENEVIYPARKFGHHVAVHRPSDRPPAPQAYQCKITQSTSMATQMKLEVILAGTRIATGVL